MPEDVKPGIKTTEFWVSIVAAVVPPVMAAGIIDENTIAAIVGIASPIVSAFGYSISRGLAKANKS